MGQVLLTKKYLQNDILSKSDEELRSMVAYGRKLMEEKYEQRKAAAMMKRLYEWIVAKPMGIELRGDSLELRDWLAKKPEFVYLD